MSTTKKKVHFTESEEGIEIKKMLHSMAEDLAYNTQSSYSANAAIYTDNVISFVEKHMLYLSTHPTTDPQHYMSNLRLMTRIKKR